MCEPLILEYTITFLHVYICINVYIAVPRPWLMKKLIVFSKACARHWPRFVHCASGSHLGLACLKCLLSPLPVILFMIHTSPCAQQRHKTHKSMLHVHTGFCNSDAFTELLTGTLCAGSGPEIITTLDLQPDAVASTPATQAIGQLITRSISEPL